MTDNFLTFALAMLGGISVFCLVVAVLVIGISRHFNRINCDAFSRNTGRQTKFVVYNFASQGDCLTPSGKGTWIPTSALREFGAKP